MTEHENETTPAGEPGVAPPDDGREADGHYDVVLLIEQALSDADARQVRSLFVGTADPVRYHLVLPVEDAAGRIEAALGTMSTGEMAGPPTAPPMAEVDREALQEQAQREAAETLALSTGSLEGAGGAVGTARAVDGLPVDALSAVIDEVGGREAIVLTRTHLVAEFFHVDWASRARRHLGVPVLHLVEQENFDEQSGGPEGVTGF